MRKTTTHLLKWKADPIIHGKVHGIRAPVWYYRLPDSVGEDTNGRMLNVKLYDY